MTKTTRICDKCKKEAKWLYFVPQFRFEGYILKVKEGHEVELCKDCMHDLIDIINTFHKTK